MRAIFRTGLLALPLAGCTTMAEPTAETWGAVRDGFIERFSPNFAINQGRREFDGKLPDVSPAGLAQRERFLRAAIARANALGDLTPVQRIERDQLVLVARDNLFKLTYERQPQRNPQLYLGMIEPSVYLTRDYASPATRLDAFIAHAGAIPAMARQIERNLELPLPETHLKVATAGFGGMADYRPARQGLAAQLPLSLGDRPAHAGLDRRAKPRPVPQRMLPG